MKHCILTYLTPFVIQIFKYSYQLYVATRRSGHLQFVDSENVFVDLSSPQSALHAVWDKD